MGTAFAYRDIGRNVDQSERERGIQDKTKVKDRRN